MRKLPLLASAVILAATVNARAGTVTNITFDSFCDGMQLRTPDGTNFSSTETGACLQGTTVTGSGAVGSTAGQRDLTLVVNWAPFEGHSQGAERLYIVQFPFVPGGTWQEFRYQAGKHCSKGCSPMNVGKYTLRQ